MEVSIKEGILERIMATLDQMKGSLNRLTEGKADAKEQLEIANAIKKIHKHSDKKITGIAKKVVDELEDGYFVLSESIESKSRGTAAELLLMGIIQSDIVDNHYDGTTLTKSESPDLPDLDLDIKSSSKKSGEGTSASFQSAHNAFQSMKARISGLEYEVLYVRIQDSKVTRLVFYDRSEFGDPYCYKLFRGASEALRKAELEDGNDGIKAELITHNETTCEQVHPDWSHRKWEDLIFLNSLFSWLVLKKNPKGIRRGDGFMAWLIERVIFDDIAEGVSQKEMKKHISEQKKFLQSQKKAAEERGDSYEHTEFLKNLKQGNTLEETSAQFRKVMLIPMLTSLLQDRFSALKDLSMITPELSKREKLILLRQPIEYLRFKDTNLDFGEIDTLRNTLADQPKPSVSISTKSFELFIDFKEKVATSSDIEEE